MHRDACLVLDLNFQSEPIQNALPTLSRMLAGYLSLSQWL